VAGRCAAELVEPGDTVIIDIGTTALELARSLHGCDGLTVVTNNLAVYEELIGDDSVDILLLGGMVRRNYRSLVGFLTEESLRGIRADLAFIGISGISEELTLLDTTLEEIPAKRAMIGASKRVVLLAGASKFWGSGLGRVADIDAVDILVTSADAPPERVDAVRERGIEVRIA
jgi:DeoR/GlpR family transcriptional regulator of sugar metabolism